MVLSVEKWTKITPNFFNQNAAECRRIQFAQKLTFAITFELIEVGLLYFTCTFLGIIHFTEIFDRVTLTMTFDLHV